MAGSGGGGGTQTVRTELDPAIRPFVEYGLREAQAEYQQGPLKFFPGQTYIGPSGMTQQGMQMAQQRALQGSPLVQGAQQTVGALQTAINPALGAFGDVYGRAMNDPTTGFFANVAGGGAQDALSMQRANQLYGQAGMGDPSAGFYQQMMGGQFGNLATMPTAQTAAGAYLGGNPFFQGAFQPAARAAQDVFNQGIQGVSSQASQAGRYGSGAMGQLQDRASNQFAQSLSDVAGQLAFQNYSQERGLQEAAMGRLGALSQQDIQNMMSGAQGLSTGAQQTLQNQMAAMQAGAGLSQQDLANRMAAAQGLSGITQQGLQTQLSAASGMGQTAAADFARQLQAAGMAPQLAAQDYADIQRLIDLGQMQEGYQEMALADAMNRFNFQQTAPQASLQNYLSAAFGSPMGAQTSQPIFRNQLGGAAFGGLAGAGLGQLAGFNPMLGAAGGALAGGLLG
jgi:hypothetical protein